ncbi:MAG: hypothetical protein JNM90_13335 [Burkholderiales bacterium]|nr:hypothetical protein [Burkholderiales bacterium]
MPPAPLYLHHAITCAPRSHAAVARQLLAIDWDRAGGALYGAWRAQIGRPRDEITAISVWPAGTDPQAADAPLRDIADIRATVSEPMSATLRPLAPTPPRRQGNYAFRWFELAAAHWDEFLALCAAAWPGFEAAYDSQVIGLWRCTRSDPARVRALLLTRRPDLAMWERSKIPADDAERAVRDRLSRRYDLCDDTWVHTTTLLSAEDRPDTVRWT